MLDAVEEIMGAAEIGALLGVSRQRVQQLINRADFPAPAKELAMGKIWLRDDIYTWTREHRPEVEVPPPAQPAE